MAVFAKWREKKLVLMMIEHLAGFFIKLLSEKIGGAKGTEFDGDFTVMEKVMTTQFGRQLVLPERSPDHNCVFYFSCRRKPMSFTG